MAKKKHKSKPVSGTVGRLVEKKYIEIDCRPKIEYKWLSGYKVINGQMQPIDKTESEALDEEAKKHEWRGTANDED